jgi:hypothetical protein
VDHVTILFEIMDLFSSRDSVGSKGSTNTCYVEALLLFFHQSNDAFTQTAPLQARVLLFSGKLN